MEQEITDYIAVHPFDYESLRWGNIAFCETALEALIVYGATQEEWQDCKRVWEDE